MFVRLLKDVEQDGRIKQSPRKAATFKPQKQPDGTIVNQPVRIGFPPLLWCAGAVIEMSAESAKKYIETGFAEPVTELGD